MTEDPGLLATTIAIPALQALPTNSTPASLKTSKTGGGTPLYWAGLEI
jgi:hypothetical protein